MIRTSFQQQYKFKYCKSVEPMAHVDLFDNCEYSENSRFRDLPTGKAYVIAKRPNEIDMNRT